MIGRKNTPTIWNLVSPYTIKDAPYSGDAIVAYSSETIISLYVHVTPDEYTTFQARLCNHHCIIHRSLHTQSLHRQIPGEASTIQDQSDSIPSNLSSSSQEKASQAYHSHPSVNTQAFPPRVCHAGSST